MYFPTKVVSSKPRTRRGVLNTILCGIFVSYVRQVGGFHQVLRFQPPIKLTATIYLKYAENGVKHHKTTKQTRNEPKETIKRSVENIYILTADQTTPDILKLC